MIRAALEFPLSKTDLATKTILRLPEMLRPTTVSLAEDEAAAPIGDVDVFCKLSKCRRSVSISKIRPLSMIFVAHPPAPGLLARI
jgi:hypothetical protein